MKIRRRFAALFTVICTLCAMMFSTPVLAAEATPSPSNDVGIEDDNPVVTGSLSGYGYVWHDYGEGAELGQVPVTGIPWYQGHLTISLENFNSNTRLKIWVFSPITDSTGTLNQTIFYRENVTINDGPWENISFNPAPTGTYYVKCEVMSNDSAGRVNCWIY